MQSKSVIFFGTDEIGSCVLEKLINLKANIIAVVTRADKPSGRNKKIIVGQVKQIALDHNIKVFQPEKLSDVLNELSNLKQKREDLWKKYKTVNDNEKVEIKKEIDNISDKIKEVNKKVKMCEDIRLRKQDVEDNLKTIEDKEMIIDEHIR